MWQWRPMAVNDIDGVVVVAAHAFPNHFEARSCFEERLALFPPGCFVLASGSAVSGYLIAYPQVIGVVPPLNSSVGVLPSSREAIYLHDLALLPGARAQGHAERGINELLESVIAMGSKIVHLVAVNGSAPFWAKLRLSLRSTATSAAMGMMRSIWYGPSPRSGELQSKSIRKA